MATIDDQIAVAQAQLANLQAQKATLDAALGSADPATRSLAVAIHKTLCTKDHGSGECTWYQSALAVGSLADDKDAADWTEPQHQFWLQVTEAAVAVARSTGWTVTEPT
jgi:hypothetical protein